MTAAREPGRRNALRPVAVRVEHLSYCAALGLGTLDLVPDAGGPETYLLFAQRDGDRLVGIRFVKVATAATHTVGLAGPAWACDCGDATHRPDRPGGCKHIAAVRQAAEVLTQRGG